MVFPGMYLKENACGRGYIEQLYKTKPKQDAKDQRIQRTDFGQMPNTFIFVAQNHGRTKNEGCRTNKEAQH